MSIHGVFLGESGKTLITFVGMKGDYNVTAIFLQDCRRGRYNLGVDSHAETCQ